MISSKHLEKRSTVSKYLFGYTNNLIASTCPTPIYLDLKLVILKTKHF